MLILICAAICGRGSQTREWKEGLISVAFREMANNSVNKHQWIVLDGDIDAGVCHASCGHGMLQARACWRWP